MIIPKNKPTVNNTNILQTTGLKKGIEVYHQLFDYAPAPKSNYSNIQGYFGPQLLKSIFLSIKNSMQGQFWYKSVKISFFKLKNSMQWQFGPKILKSKFLTIERVCISNLVQKC